MFACRVIDDLVELSNIPVTLHDKIGNCICFCFFKHPSILSFFDFKSKPLMILLVLSPYPLSSSCFLFCSLISSLNHGLGCLIGSFLVTIDACSSRTLLFNSCWNTCIVIARSRSSVTPVSTKSFMKALVSILLILRYIMFSSVGLSLFYFISHLTTQWSDINGPEVHLSTPILDTSSVKTRSMLLPRWCVPKSTHCCKPNASMVSIKN